MEVVNNIYGEVHVHTNEKVQKPKSAAEVSLIKKGIRKRDRVCQCCGEGDKLLQIHHVFPQSKYPALAWDTSNLLLLCQSCHRKYHDKYDGVEGAVSFAKFIRDNGGDFK